MKIETAITYLNGLLGSGYPKQDKAVQMAIKALEKENNMKIEEAIHILKEEIGLTIVGRQAQEAVELAIECLEEKLLR